MLVLARRVHEAIVIGDSIEISIVDIRGDQVKLGIKAPQAVKVFRREVYDAIQEENRLAAKTSTEIPDLPQFRNTPAFQQKGHTNTPTSPPSDTRNTDKENPQKEG